MEALSPHVTDIVLELVVLVVPALSVHEKHTVSEYRASNLILKMPPVMAPSSTRKRLLEVLAVEQSDSSIEQLTTVVTGVLTKLA